MKRFKAIQTYLLFILILSVSFITGCGGGGNALETGHWLAPDVVSLAVTPATASIPISGTQQFMAIATYIDGSSRDVTAFSSWTSGTAGVATVNNTSGAAIGVASGKSVVTADFDGKTGSATLTVTGATLGSIAVTPATAAVPIGGTQQFTATTTYSDGTSQNVTTSSIWTSGAIGVATVNPTSGVATGVTSGTLVITATFGGKTGSATLTVTTATLVSIAVTPVNPTLQIGATRQLTVLATYSDGTTRDVTTTTAFDSATPAKATVGASNGLTTGVAAGSSLITATFGGQKATTTVTVAPAALSFMTVTPINATIPINGTQLFSAIGTFSDGTSAPIDNTLVTWSSNKIAVATVLSSGVATGKSADTATITATSTIDGSKSGSATLIVTPAMTLLSITVAPPNDSVVINGTKTFVATGTYSDSSSHVIPNSEVSWSATVGVATVLATGADLASTGVATGKSAGTATITATSTINVLKSGSATLIVTPATTLLSITVTPATKIIFIGDTTPFVATGTFSDSSIHVIPNTEVTWSATNSPAVAIVVATGADLASTGVATGKSAGTSTITATSTINVLKSGSATLIVTQVPTLLSITVAPATKTIAIDGTTSFVATGTYSDSTSATIPNSQLTWGSDNTPVATVLAAGADAASTGVATGKSAGTATITAKSTIDSSKSGSATLIVAPGPSLLSITVLPVSSTIAIGGAETFVAKGTYSDGITVTIPNSDVAWSSNNTPVATVLSTGVASGVSGGTAMITAISGGKSGFATLIVTPPVDVALAINLRSAASFGIASRAGLTSTGVTVVNGDVALWPTATCTDSTGNAGASESCLFKIHSSSTGMTVNGSIYYAGDPFDNGRTAQAVTNDLVLAWNEGQAKVDTAGAIPADEMSGKTFVAGVYHNANLGLAIGGVATLDAQNNANAIFIFKVDSSFVDSGTTLSPSQIKLINGAQARNVWFVTGLDVTIGSGTTWKGNILAGRTVTVNHSSTVTGRVLAGASGAGAFTIVGAATPSVTTITVPAN